MCKASSDPGGPQRCSGDTRAKAARSVSEVTALETQERDLFTQLSGAAASSATPAWGPHIGPPPFANPPHAPDFDQWYAEKLAQVPDYSREHAYGHFYNLAGNVTGSPGYTDKTPEQAEQTAHAEREQRARWDHERDGTTLGYGIRSISQYVNAQPPPDYSSWSGEKMNDPHGVRNGEPLPGAVDHRRAP
ncbi:hypothetical protein BH09ACT8_BH09ACT8_55750 [soil metagenome]